MEESPQSRYEQAQQQDSAETGHRCGICGKAFERRDLRDRHKRRCVHSFSKPKRSKRRSCLACAVAKLGCDQGQPSCRRCLSRDIICDYAGEAADSNPDGEEDINRHIGNGQAYVEERTDGHNSPSTAYSAGERDSVARLLASIHEGGDLLGMGNFDGERDHMAAQIGALPVGPHGTFFGAMMPSLESSRDTMPYSMAMDDVIPSANLQLQSSRPSSHSGLLEVTPIWSPGVDSSGQNSFPFSHDFEMGMMLGNDGGHSRGSSTGAHLQFPSEQFGTAAFEVPKTGQILDPVLAQREARTASPMGMHFPKSFRRQSQPTAALPPMPAQAIVDQLLGFLPMMVSREPPAPPFIHDQIYRCSDGDVKEPIARAMVCINAHNGAMPSGRSFVYEMINKERDGLIKAFNACRSDIDMLAALHGMIVYQVLGFFSDSAEQTRAAELHNPFLLKMVRVVAQKFRGDLLENPADFVQSGWKHWTFIETLRRTVFLIHVINVTSARLAKQDRFFYEGVDDNLVLDMSLPAASPLWEASGEQEWHSAHGQLPPTAMTGRLLQRDNSGLPEDLDTFTRMIIHTLDGVPPT